jgi:hypothetical protein
MHMAVSWTSDSLLDDVLCRIHAEQEENYLQFQLARIHNYFTVSFSVI